MKKLTSSIIVLTALFVWAAPVFAKDAHAEEVIKQAREAIGGEDQLQKL